MASNPSRSRGAMPALGDSSALRLDFDAGAKNPRVLALVSPTCPVCLDGINVVLEGVRAKGSSAFGLYIAWLPVLEADGFEQATAVVEEMGSDPRVRHFWDADRAISWSAHAALELDRLDRKIAWDVYLFYRSGVRWKRRLPTPQAWLHQLRIANQPSLDPQSLSDALVMVSP
jgi:hypothetical protein